MMIRIPATARMVALVGLVGLTPIAGCASLPKSSFDRKQIATVYVLPGIEGKSRFNKNIVRGLIDGGVRGHVEIFDWTTRAGSLGWFIHLADEKRNQVQAIRLARRILADKESHPDAPVYLVAHSGGAGIALMAAERLPDAHPVQAIVLLGGAVSPRMDLSKALAHTRNGIWNFYSRRDIGFLVVGTSMFGTVDRKHTPSAGAVGFKTPAHLSERGATEYARKLTQVPFRPSMKAYGNNGGHAGWTNPKFVAGFVAPIITLNSCPTSPTDRPFRGIGGSDRTAETVSADVVRPPSS